MQKCLRSWWSDQPNDRTREYINRDRHKKEDWYEYQPIEWKSPPRIEELQATDGRGKKIPDAQRVKQNSKRIDLLSVGPEDCAHDCGNSDVNALLPKETSQN
jgi:hypothetical protein